LRIGYFPLFRQIAFGKTDAGSTQVNIDFFWQIPRTPEGHFDPNDEKSVFGKISKE
jgi:hypothetical protein